MRLVDTLQAGFLFDDCLYLPYSISCLMKSADYHLRPVYVCGPTASGKSSLSIELASRLDGEIVNADAYQIYRGLEILTAAPDQEELNQAPHHLYGVLKPDEPCDAMRYRTMALPVIAEIQSRGKVPILTGGSGMYLKFLTHGPSPVPSGCEKLRADLEMHSDADLVEQLTQIDPEGAVQTNLQNRRYVIRALEICLLSGQKMSVIKSNWKKTSTLTDKNLRGIYLLWDREQLRERINRRALQMMNQGVADEVARVSNLSTTCEKAIGVHWLQSYLRGDLSRSDCIERIAAATRQYAKRQRTWFSKETWLINCAVDESTPPDPVELATQLS